MKNDVVEDKTIKDDNFAGENMLRAERDYYLDILRNCKDICDSDNKVDNTGKCELLKFRLRYKNQEKTIVNADGLLYIGKHPNGEGRHINADIYFEKGKVGVCMKVTRVGVECENKEYSVIDVFEHKEGKLIRESKYQYKNQKTNEIIENEEMKGKIK